MFYPYIVFVHDDLCRPRNSTQVSATVFDVLKLIDQVAIHRSGIHPGKAINEWTDLIGFEAACKRSAQEDNALQRTFTSLRD